MDKNELKAAAMAWIKSHKRHLAAAMILLTLGFWAGAALAMGRGI